MKNQAVWNELFHPAELTGNPARDMATFLDARNLPEVAGHCAQVAAESRRLANRFGVNPTDAEVAGLFHDISAVIPNEERCIVARRVGIEVLPEEDEFPMIVHQRLSAVMAKDLFDITSEGILSAIGCHTTLKANATDLDKVLFVADKVRWDQPGTPPYLDDLLPAIEKSLDQAAFCYIDYLWQQRNTLRVIHPWLVDAYQELSAKLGA